ncbi:MAG TPA: pro-sigmaK processing inhibitor BofA family protein [Sporosarcina sp.]|nr:pro-sigmaK processing inhibitor BofA family protein [Sporosarcina sp.]
MKLAGILFIVGLFLLLFLMDNKYVHKVLERISIYWFRFAFAFLLLFAMNIIGGFFGFFIPVNIASGIVIAVLGIPGIASIFAFAFFL